MYGFLANVRNYSRVPPISEPRGLPEDISEDVKSESEEYWSGDGHSHSWVSLKELLDFDYEKTFEDRRCEGDGEVVSFKKFLGEQFFAQIEILKTLGDPEDVRIVFFFDN